jgi:hypothetical protein
MTGTLYNPCPGIREHGHESVTPLPMCQACQRWQEADKARQQGLEWHKPQVYVSLEPAIRCLSKISAG